MKRVALLAVGGLVVGTMAMAMPSSQAAAPVSAQRGAVAAWTSGGLTVTAEVTQSVAVNPLVDGETGAGGLARVTTVFDDVTCVYEAEIAPTDFVMDPALNAAQVTFTAADAACPRGVEATTFLLVWFGVGATTASQTWDAASPSAGATLTRGASASLTLNPSEPTEMLLEGDLGATPTASLSESAVLAAA